MRKTPAEYQREYRERKRKAKTAAPDATLDFVRTPLSESRPGDGYDPYEFVENLVFLGWQFPEGFFDEHHTYDVDSLVGRKNSYSGRPLLERMEALAGTFLDAAAELHRTINEFKLSEIDARIAEIEKADLSAPDAKASALKDIVTLQGIKSQLEGKTFRRSFAEISVKGSFSN